MLIFLHINYAIELIYRYIYIININIEFLYNET